MNPIRSDKIDATQMAKICQYAINSVIFAGLVIFCYVYMMEDAIAKSNRKGDLGCGVFVRLKKSTSLHCQLVWFIDQFILL